MAFSPGCAPADSIFARHTVGLLDSLTRAETAGKRLDDGLPESLEEVIASLRPALFQAESRLAKRMPTSSGWPGSLRSSTASASPMR
jgi:hypothetical protein